MRTSICRLSLIGSIAVLMLGSAAWAQDADRARAAMTGTIMMVALIAGVVMYLYMALALQTIADKTATANSWLAWVPVANIILMVSIAKKPLWWILLLLVPLVNIVIAIMLWMAISEARGKPNWWGILTIVPILNFVVPGYLAWSD